MSTPAAAAAFNPFEAGVKETPLMADISSE